MIWYWPDFVLSGSSLPSSVQLGQTISAPAAALRLRNVRRTKLLFSLMKTSSDLVGNFPAISLFKKMFWKFFYKILMMWNWTSRSETIMLRSLLPYCWSDAKNLSVMLPIFHWMCPLHFLWSSTEYRTKDSHLIGFKLNVSLWKFRPTGQVIPDSSLGCCLTSGASLEVPAHCVRMAVSTTDSLWGGSDLKTWLRPPTDCTMSGGL